MGYDTDHFVKVEDWSICPICLGVLQIATPSGCPSEHLFCLSCLMLRVKDYRCPICRANIPYGNQTPSILANRLIDNFAVYCYDAKAGCPWVGPLSNRYDHSVSCDYRPVKCPKERDGCTFSGVAVKLVDHIATECPYTNVACPRKCGHWYKRLKADQHEEVCTGWSCTVTEGCQTKSTKRFVWKHEKWCRQQNEQLTAVKKKLNNVKSELRRKRKTEAKRAAKAKGTVTPDAGEGESNEGRANLIPTGADQLGIGLSTLNRTQQDVRRDPIVNAEQREQEKGGCDRDEALSTAVDEHGASKPDRASTPEMKTKELQSTVAGDSAVKDLVLEH